MATQYYVDEMAITGNEQQTSSARFSVRPGDAGYLWHGPTHLDAQVNAGTQESVLASLLIVRRGCDFGLELEFATAEGNRVEVTYLDVRPGENLPRVVWTGVQRLATITFGEVHQGTDFRVVCTAAPPSASTTLAPGPDGGGVTITVRVRSGSSSVDNTIVAAHTGRSD